MPESPNRCSATLLMTCPDQKGLVHRISEFIYRNDGNIIAADQQIDETTGIFLSRVEWDLNAFTIPRAKIKAEFAPIARDFGMTWQLRFSDQLQRVAIFVSKLDHCLIDLLHRHSLGELRCEIVAVLSNHPDLAPLATRFNVPYYVFPITADTKVEQEARELELLERLNVDLIVLARYMQVLTPNFVAQYDNRLINIHHSFLPAFSGARPYEQAFDRGVKLIGATSHYVTPMLDDGPIIEQDTVRLSKGDGIEDIVRKGRDVERVVLARAVRLHLEGRVLRCGNRTITFE